MENSAVVESKGIPAQELNLAGLSRIPAVRQVILLLGLSASVAAGFAIVMWSQAPGFTTLYGELEGRDAAQIADALRAADIEYKLNAESGQIMVPEAQLHNARLQLASQGLPNGAMTGMATLNEQSSFGVSQFMENARYQHALEAELSKTIAHLGAVRDARVHLALPKRSAFIRDQKSASASVLLQLYRGRTVEPDQVSSIVHLVASSVPNLNASDVTLIDQQGRLLSAGNSQLVDAQAKNQLNHVRQIEETYVSRIEQLLSPLLGPDRVRAQVVADMDFTQTEETREIFDPARLAVRSEVISEAERTGTGIEAAGVPGALSNQPPEAADATAAGSAGVVSPPSNKSRSSTRNFEVDRTISRTRPSTGTIRRLSVAVLIDDSPVEAGANGQTSQLTDADIERFTTLVKESVGFNESRGDTVAIVKAEFRDVPVPDAVEPPKLWEQPAIRDAFRQVLGVGLVLVLAFGLVRPTLRGLLTGHAGASAEVTTEGQALLSSPGSPMPATAGSAPLALPKYEEKVAAAKNITAHDPARVAQVVKQWVTVDE